MNKTTISNTYELSRVVKKPKRNSKLCKLKSDGFTVKAGLATGSQLEEICIRAFWFIFEQILTQPPKQEPA